MGARYHVLISDQLMAIPGEVIWPAGLRPVEMRLPGPGHATHWWLLEDDNATEYLNGKQVDLVLETTYDGDGVKGSRIADRRVTQHASD